jgi:hypothetical protein
MCTFIISCCLCVATFLWMYWGRGQAVRFERDLKHGVTKVIHPETVQYTWWGTIPLIGFASIMLAFLAGVQADRLGLLPTHVDRVPTSSQSDVTDSSLLSPFPFHNK